MSEALDKQLLHALENGLPAMTEEGLVATDKNGDPIMVPPTATLLRVIKDRLKDLGITKQASDESPAAILAREAARRGLKLAAGNGGKMPAMRDDDEEEAA